MDRNAPAGAARHGDARLRRKQGADRALARARPARPTRSRRGSPRPRRLRNSKRPRALWRETPGCLPAVARRRERRRGRVDRARFIRRTRAISTSTRTSGCSGRARMYAHGIHLDDARLAAAARIAHGASRIVRRRTISSAAGCSRLHRARDPRASGARGARDRPRRRHELLDAAHDAGRERGRAAAAAIRCRRRARGGSRRAVRAAALRPRASASAPSSRAARPISSCIDLRSTPLIEFRMRVRRRHRARRWPCSSRSATIGRSARRMSRAASPGSRRCARSVVRRCGAASDADSSRQRRGTAASAALLCSRSNGGSHEA